MSKAKKLLHTRYRVDDLERTVKFYKDVLGLEETRRHKSPRGSELVFLKAPGSEELIELCHFPSSGPVHVPHHHHHKFEKIGDHRQEGLHSDSRTSSKPPVVTAGKPYGGPMNGGNGNGIS